MNCCREFATMSAKFSVCLLSRPKQRPLSEIGGGKQEAKWVTDANTAMAVLLEYWKTEETNK